MKYFLPLFTTLSFLTCLQAFAETCQEKLGSGAGSAYRFSHAVPIGNGVTECYVIAKDGKGEPIKDTVVFEDNPVESGAPSANKEAENIESNSAKKEETCEDKHKDMLECFEYESNGMQQKNYSEALKILVNLNKGEKISPKEGKNGAKSTECAGGTHWNFEAKNKYKGSILCCVCCRNTQGNPVIEDRCKASPN